MVTDKKKKKTPGFGDKNISRITVRGKKKKRLSGEKKKKKRKGEPCHTQLKKKSRDTQSVG